MSDDNDIVSQLRSCWRAPDVGAAETDYRLIADVGGAFAARSRSGLAAVVIPLPNIDGNAIGRRASGCEVVGHMSTRFDHAGREWNGAAAVLLCTESELMDAFAVLAADVVARSSLIGASWSSIVALVEEWQTLLAPRGRPSVEIETGLWGELWFIDRSVDVGRILGGWRGPERDATDFFVDRVSTEIKTARVRRHHHISVAQVDAPVGTHAAWLLSLWVKIAPDGVTVPALVDRILERGPDHADALRRIARAGFSPADRAMYTTGFVLLAEPEWYPVESVPRVRSVDPGVSQLRYRIVLDESLAADRSSAQTLWQHFHGHDYGGE